MLKIFYGIDPGKKGSLAIIEEYEDKTEITVVPYDMETFKKELFNISLSLNVPIFGIVEKVNARPGQGIQAMFNFGENFGFIQGMLYALEIPFQLISPQSWKKEFNLIHKDKQDSIKVCKQLFPKVSLLPSERCRVDSDGMAEALLMAEFARRRYYGKCRTNTTKM